MSVSTHLLSCRPWRRFKRWCLERSGAWENMQMSPAQAQALVALGVRPSAKHPLPVPAALRLPISACFAEDSPGWRWSPSADHAALEEETKQACADVAAWAPWVWAWSQHPLGLEKWSHCLTHAWQVGHVPLARCLLGVLPGCVWNPARVQAVLPWGSLWCRPVPERSVLGLLHGDWRHTLSMWSDVLPHVPDWPTKGAAWIAAAPIGMSGGFRSEAYFWRAPHLEAWLASDIPPPAADFALWLVGMDFECGPNPWTCWLEKGFDPVEGRLLAEQEAWDALQVLVSRIVLSPQQRQRLLLAWLNDDRKKLQQVDQLLDPRQEKAEQNWAQWLSSPWPPAPSENGWVHAVAQSKGAGVLGCRSLKKLSWNALPCPVFSVIKNEQLPSQAFGECAAKSPNPLNQRIYDLACQDIQAWLRHQEAQELLEEALPQTSQASPSRQRF